MHEITSHQTDTGHAGITIAADDRDEKYGHASYEYEISYVISNGMVADQHIVFQRGPVREVGTNGITNEALLAVLIDRLEGFQSGPFACSENATALISLHTAMEFLQLRTSRRIERGVEGLNVV